MALLDLDFVRGRSDRPTDRFGSRGSNTGFEQTLPRYNERLATQLNFSSSSSSRS